MEISCSSCLSVERTVMVVTYFATGRGSPQQIARGLMSSSLAEELKCLVLYDVEMEARECATRRSVLNKKQYEDLATFSWDNIVAEMIDKQTFLAEILLAVALPTGKIGNLAATEYVVPVLGTVYGMLMKERFHELSSVQKVVAGSGCLVAITYPLHGFTINDGDLKIL